MGPANPVLQAVSFGDFFVAKFKEVPDEHLKIFNEQIIDRLVEELLRELHDLPERRRPFAVEFFMAGSEAQHLAPTIVVTCFHSDCKKRVQKALPSFSWLNSLYYTQRVVLRQMEFTGSEAKLPYDTDTAFIQVETSEEKPFASGQLLKLCVETNNMSLEHDALSTLGGFVALNGQVYGLTTSHGLLRVEYTNPTLAELFLMNV